MAEQEPVGGSAGQDSGALGAFGWGTDLPVPYRCQLDPSGGLTTKDLRTALVTAVKTGTVLDLNPPLSLELTAGTHYLHPPGVTLEHTEPDKQARTDPDELAKKITSWTRTNHPSIPAHWIRTILQGNTPPDPARRIAKPT